LDGQGNGIALVGGLADPLIAYFDSKERTTTSHAAEIEVFVVAAGALGLGLFALQLATLAVLAWGVEVVRRRDA
jgi:hypothetical protein